MKPLCIDLFCGLGGGWAEGFLAEGWQVIGFDIERHQYEVPARVNGEQIGTCLLKYPAELVLQDVMTLDGRQFKNADCIVASPPCQAYSYRAMPWKRAKALPPPDNTLFEACFRIAGEACEASERWIPLIVENVRGAQKWVGRATWNVGPYFLWGNVPALMPPGIVARKGSGGGWFGKNWREHGDPGRMFTSKSPERKRIAAERSKIPFPLANWIARVYKPERAA